MAKLKSIKGSKDAATATARETIEKTVDGKPVPRVPKEFEKFSKGILILKPENRKPLVKIKHPKTFESLQSFNSCKKYFFDIIGYESIHDVIGKLSELNAWMPVMGWPPANAMQFVGDPNALMYRFKKVGTNNGGVTITEPVDDKGILEIDKLEIEGFDASDPEPGIKHYCKDNGINSDVTWVLSASQKPNSDIACIHLHFEFDQDYPLATRKILAASLGTDTSVYNGVNPVYTAPPLFRETVDGEDFPDPISRRIGFIKGEAEKLAIPDAEVMEANLRKHGKVIKGTRSENIRSMSVSYSSLGKVYKDIQSGKCYHDAMLFISSSLANKGKGFDAIKKAIQGHMKKVPEADRDERWHDRMDDDHLDSICESAILFVKNNPSDRARHNPKSYGKAVPLKAIKREKVNWDVLGFVYSDRVNLIGGDRGEGKSSICAYLAAMYSIGGEWFKSGLIMPKKRVGWLSAEESVGAEVASRLEVNGADFEMISIIDPHVQTHEGDIDFYSVLRDREELTRVVIEAGIKVLFVDTAFSFAGKTDSKSADDMRIVLLAYGRIAENAGCTIFPVVHINKSATGRLLDDISGSVQVTAAVRGALGVVRDVDTNVMYMTAIKSNLSRQECAASTVMFSFNYEFVSLDTETAFGRLIPSLFPADRTADEVRTTNIKRRNSKLSDTKAKSLSQTEWFVCKVVVDAEKPISRVNIRSAIGKICDNRQERAPGKNMVEDACKALEERSALDHIRLGTTHLYEANDQTREIARGNKNGE